MSLPPRRAAETLSVSETVRLSDVDFGYADQAPVLRGVNLTLQTGSFHFLTGASGAGKSSLLRLLTLAERPLSGRITLFGDDATEVRRADLPAYRRRMGLVFQDFRLLDHLSVFDNAALPLRLAGQKPADYAHDVREMLRWVGLGDRLAHRPTALSGGEQQRLAIARAVMGKPDLILADEPTGSVDPAMAARLLKLFQSLHAQGTTILIASHDTALAEASGARVLHLSNGQLSSPIQDEAA